MNKIGIVIKSEYLRRVSKKSFLILTILVPFIFAALVFVPLWLSTLNGGEQKQIAIVDNTGKYSKIFENTDEYKFVTSSDADMQAYRKNPDKSIFAFLFINGDLLENPADATLYSDQQVPMSLTDAINKTLSENLKNEKLASYHLPDIDKIVADSKIKFDIKAVKWGSDGKETASSSEAASMIGIVLTIISFMFIMMYGAQVMAGVMEEKTNRIVEVIVSSVKPYDLMMGKIIGIGFVGITQIFLWIILTAALIGGSALFLGGSISASDMSNIGAEILSAIGSINLTWIAINFIIYFIGGYLLFSSIYAAIGASVNQQEDSSQFMMPIMLIMLFGFYAGIYSVENPDGPLAFWCSLIPFTSPVVMMVRLPFDVPIWQVLISYVLLYATAIGAVWVSAKIYRVGILMYGKKPTFGEMIKWIRYK